MDLPVLPMQMTSGGGSICDIFDGGQKIIRGFENSFGFQMKMAIKGRLYLTVAVPYVDQPDT